jgi:hypothetical protein
MQNWWTGTPYWWANFYMGGLNWACRPLPSYVTSDWVQAVHDQGWYLVPTWVSYQAPCASSSYGAQMSSDPTTAYNQGYNEAASAISVATGLGIASGTIIYDDIEDFSGPTSCYDAVAQFVNGWSWRLHVSNYKAGIYENAAYSDLQDLCNRSASITEPDAVWIASWNRSLSNYNINGLNDYCWGNPGDSRVRQRLHQYQGNVWKTHNGSQLNIDKNTAYGPIAR